MCAANRTGAAHQPEDLMLDGPTQGPVELTLLPETTRLALRLDPERASAVSKGLGFDLPVDIGDIAGTDGRSALCLGPDEWVLHVGEDGKDTVEQAFASIADDLPHSLVDITDRDVTIALEGEDSPVMLSAACPFNVQSLAVGSGKRTLFDNAQIVLYRDADKSFRLEVARSLAPHVWGLLNIVNTELASGL